MKAFLTLCFWLLSAQYVQAQADSAQEASSNTVRRTHDEYDEEISYYGKRNEYFTVRIFRKSGELFRLDSYKLLPKDLPNGFQLDSISRVVRYGPTKILYRTGQLYITCEYKDDLLQGPFMVFYEDGSIKRREFYKYGRITQSKCYDLEGEVHKCEPFYQPTKFISKRDDLATYLKQKLSSVLDGEQIRRITATLRINEIGQVVNVSVSVNAASTAHYQVAGVSSYVQQVIRNMPEWTPDKLNWKPAINDGAATSSTCVLSVFRVYGSIQYDLSYRM
ncbi:toxin-antitoxin system YwqK family antitoxin [Spirosoma sp.]|uniref:toxin-antitoxin system YwqK family antitoxin n=1 Tax=Spirosoma sp. TaxID=1899569 RepID=UPI003B3B931F